MSDITAATITVNELAELLLETGHHHQRAYIESDGTDPEWAMWYVGCLQSHHPLLTAHSDHEADGGDSPRPPHFAPHDPPRTHRGLRRR